MYRFKLLTVLLLFAYKLANTQELTKDVLDEYSPGTIMKLYDIAKVIPITKDQQIQIAKQIETADKILVELINQGKSQSEIGKFQQALDIKILNILGKDAISYSGKKAEDFARTAANGETRYLREAYKIDTILSNRLYLIQFNKYKSLYQQFLLYGFVEAKASEQIEKTLSRYDSLLFTSYRSIYSSKYLTNYLQEVKKVKQSIPDTIMEKIKISFYESIKKNAFIDWGQIILDVMQRIYPDTTITAHFYRQAIEKQASYLSSAEKYTIINIYHVSRRGYDSIYSLLKEKNFHRVLLEYTYGTNSKILDSLIVKTSRYYDSTAIGALLRDGSLLAYNQFAIALKYKNSLKIPPSLTDTLLWHAMHLRDTQDSILLREPYAKLDFKAYEARYMNELLTEGQYTQLLTIKNRSQAQIDTDNDWEDMQKWGLANTLDKELVKKELFRYYITKWNIYYRMANDKVKQEATLQSLKDDQPSSLKMLTAAKKRPPVNENTTLKLKW